MRAKAQDAHNELADMDIDILEAQKRERGALSSKELIKLRRQKEKELKG